MQPVELNQIILAICGASLGVIGYGVKQVLNAYRTDLRDLAHEMGKDIGKLSETIGKLNENLVRYIERTERNSEDIKELNVQVQKILTWQTNMRDSNHELRNLVNVLQGKLKE